MSGYRNRGGAKSSWKQSPKGIFEQGIWKCDCNPRLPAVHFQVKKEGANKGRWFHSCQKQVGDGDRCKFFIWAEDAKRREESAVLSNSRTEPDRNAETTPSRPRRTGTTSPPPPYAPLGGGESSRKRSRPIVEDDEDDEYGQGDSENELRDIVSAVETPSKVARTTSNMTPGRRKLPWLDNEASESLPTPQTDRRFDRDPFPTIFSAPGGSLLTPSKVSDDDVVKGYRLSSPSTTPTPSRFKDVGSGSGDDTLIKEVFAFLQEKNANFNDDTRIGLTQVLKKYSRSAEGIRRGRETTRTQLAAKEAKVSELQGRINTLEAELEAERSMVRLLRWEAETGDREGT